MVGGEVESNREPDCVGALWAILRIFGFYFVCDQKLFFVLNFTLYWEE